MTSLLGAMTTAGNESSSDAFPVGMSVLAVDDDPISLEILESMLRKCCYHVTTTSEAGTALKLLRDRTNKFDLMIAEVQLADMSGLELLEYVAKETDLPVILMSKNSDTSLVMKGVSLGASDYLLKPIRMLEVKTIWQHVIRNKKKLEARRRTNVDKNEADRSSGAHKDQGEDLVEEEKVSKKRKDPNWEDDKENDESSNPSSNSYDQRKHRIIWEEELHESFVGAVDFLGGPHKATPKQIVELMSVEGLRREDVASHLQKYRLYLKKSSMPYAISKLNGSENPGNIKVAEPYQKLDEIPDLCNSGSVATDHIDPNNVSCGSISGSMVNKRFNAIPNSGSFGSVPSQRIDPTDVQSANDSFQPQNNASDSSHQPSGLGSELAGIPTNPETVTLLLNTAMCNHLTGSDHDNGDCARNDQTMEVDLPCSSSNECNECEFASLDNTSSLQDKRLDGLCDCFSLLSVIRCLGLSK